MNLLAQGVYLYDNVLTDPGSVSRYMDTTEWQFGKKSNVEHDTFSFFHKHFAGALLPDHVGAKQFACEEELRSYPAILNLWNCIRSRVSSENILVRCYANAMAYGCDGTVHTDLKNDRSYTFIYYPMTKWNANWGGETVFLNEARDEIIASVLPKPNRLVAFKGTIPHLARGPTRTCPLLRTTVMFKTEQPRAS